MLMQAGPGGIPEFEMIFDRELYAQGLTNHESLGRLCQTLSPFRTLVYKLSGQNTIFSASL